MKRYAVAAALVASISMPAVAQQASPSDNDKMTAEQFVQSAAITNMFEIQSGKLALDKSKNSQVDKFAQEMVDDHTKAENELKSAVDAEGGKLKLPSELDDAHQGMIEQLHKASGEQFAREYATMEVDGHEQAVHMVQNYAQNGDDLKLKQWAQKTLPVLQDHLKKSLELLKQVRS